MKNKMLLAPICAAIALSLSGCTSSDLETAREIERPVNDIEAPLPDAGTGEPDAGTLIPAPDDAPQAPAVVPPIANDTPVIVPPEQKADYDVLLRCTANGLNVRKGAGRSYAILGTLDKDDMVMPVRKIGGWYEILYSGASAYVSADYLTEAKFEKSSPAVERIITEGKKLLGKPYVYGAQRYHFGNGALNRAYDGKSYDCSSLMQYIFKVGGNIDLAMTSREQSLQGRAVARSQIRRGDLLFFTNSSRYNRTGLERIGHVALYLGDNIILHTASDHAVIEPISESRSGYYITARRMTDGA